MSKSSIALNRFGYGLRRDESAPTDAARSLRRQMDAFEPKPALLRDRPGYDEKPGEILEMLRQFRRQRQMEAAGGSQDMPPMMEGQNGADPLNGLPPDIRQSYMSAARSLREDIGLRTKVAVTSPAPFMERMAHFWSNHFSVSAQKPGTHFQVADHEYTAIRPNLLGNFADLLKAAVLHPAMLLYLDQFQSVGPDSQFMQMRARRRRNRDNTQGGGPRGLNENLAREILELHTLGVDGGYNQADVTEFARALTGWTIQGIRRVERFSEPQSSGAAFVAMAHQPGSRQIMGRTYREEGAAQALSVLDDLARHPSTAKFIATKLARHFAGDDPPESLIARLENNFLQTGGDLASLTRTLIEAPEVWTAQPVKFRQPFEWLVAVMRMTGVDDLPSRRIAGMLDQLGQMPWRAPSPAGYDDRADSWAGPDALFRRVELAERIARNTPSDDVLTRADASFPDALSQSTRTWLSRAESGSQALGLLLVSPEMMRR